MKFLAVLLALTLPPALYFPILGARLDAQHERADRELRDATVRLEQARAAQRKLPQFHEELARLEAENVKLRDILPPVLAVEDIRNTLQSLSGANSVSAIRFVPGKPQRQDRLQQIAIETEVTGNAPNTAAFLQGLVNASRVFDIGSVTMRPDPAGWRTAFVLTAYAWSDRSAAPAPAPPDRVADASRRR